MNFLFFKLNKLIQQRSKLPQLHKRISTLLIFNSINYGGAFGPSLPVYPVFYRFTILHINTDDGKRNNTLCYCHITCCVVSCRSLCCVVQHGNLSWERIPIHFISIHVVLGAIDSPKVNKSVAYQFGWRPLI